MVRIILFCCLLIANSAFAECGNLCTWHWWLEASENSLQEEIENGADINGRNFHDGDTPLHEASKYGSASLIEQLVEAGANLESKNAHGLTPLLSAARDGLSLNRDVRLAALIDSGANLNVEQVDGSNPIHLVMETGDFDYVPSHLSVKLLVESGVSLNKQNKSGITPLHLAAKFSPSEDVKYILKSGGDPLILDRYGNSVLHYAAAGKFTENIELLVKYGAVLDMINNEGVTPLHVAAGSNRLNNVNALLSLGANANARDQRGWNALFFSLESASAKMNASLMHAGSFSPEQRSELIRLLIEAGCDVNLRSNNGNRPLHIAAEYAAPSDVQLLLKNNADPRVENIDSETPFNLGSRNGVLRSSKVYWELQPN